VPRFLSPYRRFLALPDVRATLLIAFLSRIPVGMMGLSMVMYLRETLGSFKIAGSVLGVYFLSMAIAAPIQGRLIDRIGPTLPLRITGVLEPIAFALLIVGVDWRWPLPFVFLFAVLMGVFSPPITVLTRTLWRHRFDSDGDRRMAFAVDSVLMEINFTVGPALIGILLAATNSRIAIWFAWVMLLMSIAVFFKSPALRYWKQEAPGPRHWLGPLTDPKLLLLFTTVFGLTTACGLLEVGYPAYATASSLPAFAGLLLSLNSFGSALGGAIYGGIHVKAPVERQFAALLALFAVPLLLHGVIDQHFAFALVAFCAGFTISPAFAAQALMVSRLAPAKYATEAFTWSATFIVCGLGAGMALGGTLSETVHVKAPFVSGGMLMLSMAGLALFLHTRASRNALH
jgi:MFS family permease